MRPFKLNSRFVVVSVLLLVLGVVAFSPGTERLLAQSGRVPSELVLGMIPSREPAVLLPDLEPFSQLLLGRLQARGFNIQSAKAFVPESEAATIAALGTGEIDVGFMGPFSAVQAEQEAGALIVTSSVRFGTLFYRGQLMTNRDTGLANINDVIKAVKGGQEISMSYTSTSSTSGFLFPCAKLNSLGILPANFPNFKTVVAGGHTASALAVLRKDVTIGWGFDDVRQSLIGREAETGLDPNKPEFDRFKKLNTIEPVIGYTDYIPNDPQVVAGDLDPDLQTAIQEELVSLSNTPEGADLLNSLLDSTEFIAVESSAFDPVRQVVSEVLPIRDSCLNQ